MSVELKSLWEVFQNKKIDLLNWWQHQDFVQEQIDLILSWWVINYDDRVSDSPIINNWLNISYEDMLKHLWINLLQLEGKNIVDLWWWFSILPFLFNWMTWTISIVDPIFRNWIIKHLESNKNQLFKNIWKLENKIIDFQVKLNSNQDFIDYLDISIISECNLFNSYTSENNKIINSIKKLENAINTYKKILIELSYWDNFNEYESYLSTNWLYLWETNLKLITDIELDNYWIEEKTADIIFINHVITKSTVDPFKMLDNAFNILKKWWKCYITENDFISIDNCEWVYNNFYINSYQIKTPYNKTICVLEKK